MKQQPLNVFAAVIVVSVLTGLSSRASSLSQQLRQQQEQNKMQEQRLEATVRVADDALRQLEPHDTAKATELRGRLTLAKDGDVRWLEPEPNPDLKTYFEQML